MNNVEFISVSMRFFFLLIEKEQNLKAALKQLQTVHIDLNI